MTPKGQMISGDSIVQPNKDRNSLVLTQGVPGPAVSRMPLGTQGVGVLLLAHNPGTYWWRGSASWLGISVKGTDTKTKLDTLMLSEYQLTQSWNATKRGGNVPGKKERKDRREKGGFGKLRFKIVIRKTHLLTYTRILYQRRMTFWRKLDWVQLSLCARHATVLQHKLMICIITAYFTSDMFKQQLFLFGFRNRGVTDSLGGFCIPTRSAPSSGAGCYGDRWHGRARSSSGKAGSRGTADICSENPSCSRSGSRSIPLDGRLDTNEERAGDRETERERVSPLTDKSNTVLGIYVWSINYISSVFLTR